MSLRFVWGDADDSSSYGFAVSRKFDVTFRIVTMFTTEYLRFDLIPEDETAVTFEVEQGEDNAGPHHLRRDLFDKKYVVIKDPLAFSAESYTDYFVPEIGPG